MALRVAAAMAVLGVSGCGTPNSCLANRYDGYAPQYRCAGGVQLPFDILKDTDPMSGSTAPVSVAQ